MGNLSNELESAIEAGYSSCLVQSDLELGKQTVVRAHGDAVPGRRATASPMSQFDPVVCFREK